MNVSHACLGSVVSDGCMSGVVAFLRLSWVRLFQFVHVLSVLYLLGLGRSVSKVADVRGKGKLFIWGMVFSCDSDAKNECQACKSGTVLGESCFIVKVVSVCGWWVLGTQ